MPSASTIALCLSGKIPLNKTVLVQGWVKTRRDSKAGISFITLHDGSCHAGIQLVIPSTLANYQSDILHITPGCSLIAQGFLIASQGQKQKFEVQTEQIEVLGWGDD